MKRSLATAVLLSLLFFSAYGAALAEDLPESGQEKTILIISNSDLSKLRLGDMVKHYESIDKSLMGAIANNLREHGLVVILSQGEAGRSSTQYADSLSYKLLKVEFGFKTPFGRHTNVKASYEFRKRDGTLLISGEFEEHSKKSWNNCVVSISRQIASDVSLAVAGKYLSRPPNRDEAGSSVSQDGGEKNIEERLRQLNGLKEKGLITQKEYEEKRSQILGDL